LDHAPIETNEADPESRGDLASALLVPLVRSRWVVLACVVLGAAAGVAMGIVRPNTYVSVGKLLVRPSSREESTPESVIAGPAGAAGGQVRDQVNNELQLLSVPRVFELVAKKVTPPRIFSVYNPAAGDTEETSSFTKLFHEYQSKWFQRGGGEKSQKIGHAIDNCPACVNEAIHVLQTDIRLGVEPGSSVITVSYGAHDPSLAREVVSAFMDAAETHHREAFSTNSTLEFVKTLLQQSEKQEQDSATEFSEYKNSCGVTDYETQRLQFMTEVRNLEQGNGADYLRLEQLKSKEKVVAAQLENVQARIEQTVERSSVSNPNWILLSARVLTLEDNLEDLSYRVGGTTAQLEAARAALQRRIDRAKADLDKELQWIDQKPTQQFAPNPEYARLKQDHDNVLQEIAQQEAIVAKGAERLKTAQERVRRTEECAPRYKQLEGQYTDAKANRDNYSKALERATLMNLADGLQFSNLRRIQDGSLPFEKEGPKRSKFVLIGLILGFVGGGGFGFLRLQLDPRLRSPSEVEAVLGHRVLGVVPPSGLPWRLRRMIQRAGG
jgi:uncharacterized protein involved in exopolysaccharide biosynthesis